MSTCRNSIGFIIQKQQQQFQRERMLFRIPSRSLKVKWYSMDCLMKVYIFFICGGWWGNSNVSNFFSFVVLFKYACTQQMNLKRISYHSWERFEIYSSIKPLEDIFLNFRGLLETLQNNIYRKKFFPMIVGWQRKFWTAENAAKKSL